MYAAGAAVVLSFSVVRYSVLHVVLSTVLTAAGARFAPGYVVVVAGRIQSVGSGEPPPVSGARVIDVTGQFVTPGLIDSHPSGKRVLSPEGADYLDGLFR